MQVGSAQPAQSERSAQSGRSAQSVQSMQSAQLAHALGSELEHPDGGGDQIAESIIVDALMFAHDSCQPLIEAQLQLREEMGHKKRDVPPEQKDENLAARVNELAKLLGITHLLDRAPDKLSGGEAQRGAAFALRRVHLDSLVTEKTL